MEVGGRLESERLRIGRPSFTTIERYLIAELGADVAPRSETIRAWHKGLGPDPGHMNLELIGAFARYYGCSVGDLSTTAGQRLARLLRGNREGSADTGVAITRRYRRRPVPTAA